MGFYDLCGRLFDVWLKNNEHLAKLSLAMCLKLTTIKLVMYMEHGNDKRICDIMGIIHLRKNNSDRGLCYENQAK